MPDAQLSLDGDGDLVLTPEMIHPGLSLPPDEGETVRSNEPIYDALRAELGKPYSFTEPEQP
jgi:hypothetical protein